MANQEPHRRSRRSDWFGSDPFNWWSESIAALFPLWLILMVAVLAAMLFPVFARARENARRCSTETCIRETATAVGRYHRQHRRWPSETECLDQIGATDRDAWGHPIRYGMPKDSRSATVESAGRDGHFGTSDDIRQVIHKEAE